MNTVIAPLIFVVHTLLQVMNLVGWASLAIILGVMKLATPFNIQSAYLTRCMHRCMFGFGTCSVGMIRWFSPIQIEYRLCGELSTQGWYLIMANHLSYLDIILLIDFAASRIPAPKFFLKRELIWLPLVGLGARALEMPFMRRYSQAYLKKNPHRKGMDIETTKRYCQKFKLSPTTVINFVEGTRYTSKKHLLKKSSYQHLLPPKAGGVAFTLATMGDLFTNMLDISLLYPHNRKHPMLGALSGQMRRAVIDVQVIDIPHQAKGDYDADEQFRCRFQSWLNGLWAEKDLRIQNMMEPEQ